MSIRDRIKEIRRMKAADVLANPKNFRIHNDYQRQQLRSILDEVGFAGIQLAYLHVREQHMNIPPNWVSRAHESRKAREKELVKMLKAGKLNAANYIREWELCFKKECFYRGLRALLDMERTGKTKL